MILSLIHILFRMGMARTRKEARQIVDHKHVLVNGKQVNIPSYLCLLYTSLLLTDNRKGKCAMTKMGKKKKKGLVAALSVVAVIVLLSAAYGIFLSLIHI